MFFLICLLDSIYRDRMEMGSKDKDVLSPSLLPGARLQGSPWWAYKNIFFPNARTNPGSSGTIPFGSTQIQHWCLTFFLLKKKNVPPCYLNGFKHETRPGKGGSIVLIISNYDRCNINCIFP